MSTIARHRTADAIDLLLIGALIRRPDATAVALAESTGLSRNTVRARLARYDENGSLSSFERRVNPAFLGYPLTAHILTNVNQSKLEQVSRALGQIAEIIEVSGLSGTTDLLVHVVAIDADDLYRIAGQILVIDGVERTNTALVMRELVKYRIAPLVEQVSRSR